MLGGVMHGSHRRTRRRCRAGTPVPAPHTEKENPMRKCLWSWVALLTMAVLVVPVAPGSVIDGADYHAYKVGNGPWQLDPAASQPAVLPEFRNNFTELWVPNLERPNWLKLFRVQITFAEPTSPMLLPPLE
jgi:hypothetical protein